MRKFPSLLLFAICVICVICGSSFAQDTPLTNKFPAELNSLDSFGRTADRSQGTLTAAINSSVDTFTITGDPASYPASGIAVVIDNEIILCTSRSSGIFSGCLRGQKGTAAASHTSGTAVKGAILSAQRDVLVADLLELEKKIGFGGSPASSATTGFCYRKNSDGTTGWSACPGVTSGGLTKTDDANVTLTFGGTPAAALLTPVSITVGWTGTLAKSRQHAATVYNDQANSYSSGNAQSFFAGTNFELKDPTTPTKKAQFDLSNIAAGQPRFINIPNADSTTAQPKTPVASQWLRGMSVQGLFEASQPSCADLSNAGPFCSGTNAANLTGTIDAARLPGTVPTSVVNDTNVTGSIAGNVLTLIWASTLAAGRLNANVVQAITNDTNITGSIASQNLTLGWAGQLSVARGGTNKNSWTAGSIPYLGSSSAFAEDNSNLFWDATNKRLGIGTATPNARFTLTANTGTLPTAPAGTIGYFANANGVNTYLTMDAYQSSGTIHPDFVFRHARGTMTNPTASQANDIVGQLQARPHNGSDFTATARAAIRFSAGENMTSGLEGMYMGFFTTAVGGATLAERLRITDAGHVWPGAGYAYNVGDLTKKFLTLHVAELWAETLVAADTQATIGGRILVGPTTQLTADIAAGATSISVKHNNLANGDRVYLEANNQVEFIAVTSPASGSGPYTYTVTRNLDGSGANAWTAGDAVFNTGTTGSGFIDIYSVRGVKSSSQVGPAIVGNIRNSATYNDWSEHWAIGQLNGLYGYSGSTYGVAFGKYAAGTPHITIDALNGYRIFSGTSTVIGQWDNNGNMALGEVATNSGNAYWNNSNKRFEFRGGSGGTVVQAYVDTTGAIVAGTVKLDAGGLTFPGAGDIQVSGSSAIVIRSLGQSGTPDSVIQLRVNNFAATSELDFRLATNGNLNYAYLDGGIGTFLGLTIGADEIASWGILDVRGVASALLTDAGTSGHGDVFLARRNSTGTPAATFGAYVRFILESSTTENVDAGRMGFMWTTATHASRTSAFVIQTVNNAGGLTEAARFDGNGDLTEAGAIRSSSATAGIGYALGAGGTAIQGTSKSTGVTLNKACGTITLHNAALAAAGVVTFTVTNSAVAATDVIHVQHDSGGTIGAYVINANTPAAGSFKITLTNISAGSLSEAIVLRFAVVKAVIN